MTRGFQRFPDFGADLRRDYPVHENCYDCAAIYDGCDAWPAAKGFSCGHYQRLSDVIPGTYGQKCPEDVFVPTDPASERTPAKAIKVTGKPDGPRRCKCGQGLAKGKRYCATCRQRRRQDSKRQYMKTYMQTRRESMTQPTACSGSSLEATGAGVCRRTEQDRTLGPPRRKMRTSVLTRSA